MTEFTSFTCLECGEAQGIHRAGCSRLQRSVPVSALQDLIAQWRKEARLPPDDESGEYDTGYGRALEVCADALEARLPR